MYGKRGGIMMEQYSYPFLIAFIIGSVFSVLIHTQNKKEKNGGFPYEERSRYPAIISPYRLPIYACTLILFWPLSNKDADFLTKRFLEVFSIFLHVSLYHAVLLLVMPIVRKKISARVCALLWTVPTVLYIIMYSYYTGLPRPWLVIHLPQLSFKWLCVIWGIGFASVLLWKVISHLRFREWILKASVPVKDPLVLRLWEEEQMVAQVWKGYKTDRFRIPLVLSEYITTPLTIGLWRNSIYMVLPQKSYTEDEYRLIFRHELVHIGREDNGNKFLLVFCTAMCWFNPLMWIAMKQCATDFERSCDETVLLDADMDTKKQYAYLLLQTAGDDRGFTTCLSSSGASMRYRLESALGSSKRHVGSIVAGICVFGTIFCYGMVTMSYDAMSAGDAIYYKNNPYQLSYVETDRTKDMILVEDAVEKSLRQYLNEQQVYQLTNSYAGGEERIELRYDNPRVTVRLLDQMMEVRFDENRRVKKQYYFAEPLDWEYLYGLLEIKD